MKNSTFIFYFALKRLFKIFEITKKNDFEFLKFKRKEDLLLSSMMDC